MSEGAMRIGLIVFGAINLATGGLMVIAPDTFFEEIGPYGVQNDHYLGDAGAFYLAAGAGLVIAASRPSWRVPILVVAAIWYGLHALNHLADIGENNESDARGIADTVLIAIGAVFLGLMARAASQRPETGTEARAAATVQRPQPETAGQTQPRGERRVDYPPGD